MLAETEDTGTEDYLGFGGIQGYRLVVSHCRCYCHRKEATTAVDSQDSRFSCHWDRYKHHQVTPISSQHGFHRSTEANIHLMSKYYLACSHSHLVIAPV